MKLIYKPIIKETLGILSNAALYPIANKIQSRKIPFYVKKLKKFDSTPADQRQRIQRQRLAEMIDFSAANVPYYKDLQQKHKVTGAKILQDLGYLDDIPFLTKDIIREQEQRLISRPLHNGKYYTCKTGGSTGASCIIFYDEEAADRSAAVTRHARHRIGRRFHRSELHFAAKFDNPNSQKRFDRETLKSAALNRSNILISDINDEALFQVYQDLKTRRPYLVHAHPSTMYYLSLFVKEHRLNSKLFVVFEPSGEYCSDKMFNEIQMTFNCSIHNRYGLAEFGVVGYSFDGSKDTFEIFASEVFCETTPDDDELEIVITGLQNKLMPLIRYKTGDLSGAPIHPDNHVINTIKGRVHDKITIGSRTVFTHYVQDIIDHKVGGIAEFQIVKNANNIDFLICPEPEKNHDHIRSSLLFYFPEIRTIKMITPNGFYRVGRHDKFKHLVTL